MKYQSLQSARRTLTISLLLLALSIVFIGVVYAAAAVTRFEQCDNGNPPFSVCNWVTGNLNSVQDTYFEGMATAQRAEMTGLTGANHTIAFTMQWTKAGHHAYDWPVSWAQAEALAQSIGHFSLKMGPLCAGITGGGANGDLTKCQQATITTTANVPIDSYISAVYGLPATNGNTNEKELAFAAVYGTPQIQIVSDQPITFTVRPPVHDVANQADTGDSQVTYTLDITGTGPISPTVFMLVFAAHIAISDAPGDPSAPGTTWGQGQGAKNISGSPYHVNTVSIDGSSSSQDNQMSLGGTPLTPDLVTNISNSTRTLGQSVSDVVTMTLSKSTILSGTLNFYVCGPTAVITYCLPQSSPQITVSTHAVSTTGTSVVRTSSLFTPTQNGAYCFRVVWLNQDFNSQSWEAFDTTNECVTVTSSTAVRLSSMRAARAENGVMLNWATGSEISTAGFNLYRAESQDGPYTRINAQLIPASPNAVAGSRYEFTDTTALPGKTYYYQLEDVELNGKSTRHNPVVVNAPEANALERNMPIAVGAGLGAFVLIAGGLLAAWKKLNSR